MTTRPRAVIDLAAIAANWRRLSELSGDAETGAVVKADAYGLGAAKAAWALAEAGCRTFFVAHVFEGARLRSALGDGPRIIVFHGASGDEVDICRREDLIPVLNTLDQVRIWDVTLRDVCEPVLHVDTGMNRLGVRPSDLSAAQTILGDVSGLLMSHFACADEPDHPLNAEQLGAFDAAAEVFPSFQRSMANSAGIFLGGATHDLTRPGIALYGGGPQPLAPVVTLEAPILAVFDVEAGAATGYGATKRFDAPARLATCALGYADGLATSASNQGFVIADGARCPIVGRVSMDLITIDVSEGPSDLSPGHFVQVFGADADLEAQAAAAKRLDYELLTGMGERVERIWR